MEWEELYNSIDGTDEKTRVSKFSTEIKSRYKNLSEPYSNFNVSLFFELEIEDGSCEVSIRTSDFMAAFKCFDHVNTRTSIVKAEDAIFAILLNFLETVS